MRLLQDHTQLSEGVTNVFNDLIIAFHKDMHDKNEIRKKEQEKQYVYYSGNAHEIKRYLEAALAITYTDPQDVQEMQLQFVNLTTKIINQMAVVYREPAIRHMVFEEPKVKITKDEDGNDIEENLNKKEEEELTEYYNTSVLSLDINTQDKRAHRLASLHNMILTQVMLNEKTGKIKYKTRPSYLYDVVLDDNDDIIEVSYPRYYEINGNWGEFKVYWTDSDLYMLDASGNKMNLPNKSDKKNPFGVLPFALIVMEEGDEWGEGKNDVINVCEQVNFLLTKLVNRDIILGTEGTLVGINLGLQKKSEEEGGEKKVRAGVSHVIEVNEVKSDELQPSLQHVTTSPHILDIKDTIDWYIMYIAGVYGLRGSDIISQIKDTSDYQKIMDSVDQMELRREDVEALRVYEKARFNITRTVFNSYVGTETGDKFKLKEIPEDVILKVDFADVEIQKTPDDIRKQRDWELGHGLSTEAQWMMEDNPDITEEKAKEQIKNNKEESKPKSRFEIVATEGANSNTQTGLTGLTNGAT